MDSDFAQKLKGQFVTAKLQLSTSWWTQSDFNTMKSYSRREWSADFGDMVL